MTTIGTSDRCYRAVHDGIGDVVTVIDRDREVVSVNRRFIEAAGIPRSTVLGTPIGTLIERAVRGEDAAAAYREAIDRVIDGGSDEERIEVPAWTEPLGEHVIEARITPYVVDGRRDGAIIVARDISRRKDHERVIEEQARTLTVLNRLLRHDIRNDMTIVTGWLELLGTRDEVDRELIGKAQRAARHTLELTETAREYTRLITGEDTELRSVDIADAVEGAVDRHEELHGHADFVIEGELPHVEVRATGMVQSVFTNLLRNAVQHNDADAPRVTVSAEETETTVVIRIADNGPGVPEARKRALMDREPTALDEAGTGLGLYLVRQLVAECGGEVRLEDNTPEGTIAVVELRKAQPPAAA